MATYVLRRDGLYHKDTCSYRADGWARFCVKCGGGPVCPSDAEEVLEDAGPRVDIVGREGEDSVRFLLACPEGTWLGNAHALFNRTAEALKSRGWDVDAYAYEALGKSYKETLGSPDYPSLLRNNYERLVRVSASLVDLR